MTKGPISSFIKHHYRHFNAATLVDASEAYIAHLDQGGKMFMTLAGAMSTAELGVSLAEMIRQEKYMRFVAPARIWKKTFSIWWRTTSMSACRTGAI